MFLLTTSNHRRIFDLWFCCGCLAVIAPVEILAYLSKEAGRAELSNIFTLHSIPLGTLMILLSPGLVRLFTSETTQNLKMLGGLLAAGAFALILLAKKRGTFLAILAMVLLGLSYRRSRLTLTLATVLLVAALLIPLKNLSGYLPLNHEIPSHFSILHRLELYPFALHVYLKHPIFGIGLRPFTHDKYLADYQQKNRDLSDFPKTVKKLQTFDNMLLTGLVELGTLMTLTYLFLIGLIIFKYCQKLGPLSQCRSVDFYRLLVIIGVIVHSVTYDSMMFPSVNWLFHVQLGILAGYSPAAEPKVRARP